MKVLKTYNKLPSDLKTLYTSVFYFNTFTVNIVIYVNWTGFLINKQIFAFSLSHGNTSKDHPIVLKFGTHVAFKYCQIEFVDKKLVNWYKRYLKLKSFFLILNCVCNVKTNAPQNAPDRSNTYTDTQS